MMRHTMVCESMPSMSVCPAALCFDDADESPPGLCRYIPFSHTLFSPSLVFTPTNTHTHTHKLLGFCNKRPRNWTLLTLTSIGTSFFLAAPFTYGLALNIDWFQLFSHTVYSVGVMYATILNLPRHMRYKRKNILLLGIIPGPSEPAHDINHFLEPLVSELKQFLSGIPLKIHTETGIIERTVRCALLCIACDLPAGRTKSLDFYHTQQPKDVRSASRNLVVELVACVILDLIGAFGHLGLMRYIDTMLMKFKDNQSKKGIRTWL